MTKSKLRTLVILDTHAIIHRAYHAIPPLTSPSGEPVQAVYGLISMIIRIIAELKPDVLIAAYDLPGGTHRHEVYKDYKAKRPKIDESLVLQITRSRDALAALGIPIYEAPGFEADDVIGTITEKEKKNFNIIIASGDMDTLQLVDGERVRVFTMRKGMTDTVLYDTSAVVARYGFEPKHVTDYKGLAGDTSDNIIGIPGIGEKTATELILKFGSIEAMYKSLKKNKNALVDAGFKERVQTLVSEHQDEAEFSKVLATIRTDAPVTLDVPTGNYRDTFDSGRAIQFANELGFRSLISRIKSVGTTQVAPTPTVKEVKKVPTIQVETSVHAECKVMVWLLNSEMTDPTWEDVVSVAGEESAEKAHAILLKKIVGDGVERVFQNIEQPLIPVVQRMSANGMMIDKKFLEELSTEYHAELTRIAGEIHADAGLEFNIASPKQLGEVLFTKMGLGAARQKKTAGGQLSTKESELQKLIDTHPIIAKILQHRELSKLLGTYIDAIPPLLDADSRLHTTFIQTGAATGRMASKDPGVQNIPTKTELGRRIRSAFVAPKGRSLLTLDYSQIELRIAAILSGDEKLRDIFRRGEDVHAAVAAQVFGIEQSAVSKEQRRRAKVINFGILYGMGVNALREQLGTDRSEAQEFMNTYFETFATLSQFLDATVASAKKDGYTTTLYGRKRHFPGMRSPLPFIRASAERMAINAPIQGTQADIIKLAMIKVDALLSSEYKNSALMTMQIHDELMFEADDSLIDELATQIKSIMESVLTVDETFGVPILVTSSRGHSWGTMESI